MATRYAVRDLSYAFIVEWGGDGRGRQVAIVNIQDEQLRLFYCCRCRTNDCLHTQEVVHHVIDLESR